MIHKLNDKQLDTIRNMYENSEEFRNVIAAHVNQEAQKLAGLFCSAAATPTATEPKPAKAPAKPKKSPKKAPKKAPKKDKPKKKAPKGQARHTDAIINVLGNKAMSYSEIAQALAENKHVIDSATLRTTLFNMKKKSEKSKNGLKGEGERGNTKYSVVAHPA